MLKIKDPLSSFTVKYLLLRAFFEDFEQGKKGQAYAKRCAILSDSLFTRDFFWCKFSISTYTQFSKKRQKNAS